MVSSVYKRNSQSRESENTNFPFNSDPHPYTIVWIEKPGNEYKSIWKGNFVTVAITSSHWKYASSDYLLYMTIDQCSSTLLLHIAWVLASGMMGPTVYFQSHADIVWCIFEKNFVYKLAVYHNGFKYQLTWRNQDLGTNMRTFINNGKVTLFQPLAFANNLMHQNGRSPCIDMPSLESERRCPE